MLWRQSSRRSFAKVRHYYGSYSTDQRTKRVECNVQGRQKQAGPHPSEPPVSTRAPVRRRASLATQVHHSVRRRLYIVVVAGISMFVSIRECFFVQCWYTSGGGSGAFVVDSEDVDRAAWLRVVDMSLSAPAQAVRSTRTNSLDQLDFQERRQLIASSLSLTDFLHVGAKEVAAVAG